MSLLEITQPTPLRVRPDAGDLYLLLTATRPISHHDPAATDDSNVQLFNREAKLLQLPQMCARPTQPIIDAFCTSHPAPSTVRPILADLDFPAFIAAALVRTFIDLYNSADGEGVFAGVERYSRLESRLRYGSVRSHTLRGLWDRLTQDLSVPIAAGDHDSRILAFTSLPRGLQSLVLAACATDYRSIVMIARFWHSEGKLASPDYARKAARETLDDAAPLAFDPSSVPALTGGTARIETFELSNNTLRHQVVRAPGFLHLATRLGIAAEWPGEGALPAGVEALFVNGGNIASGAKQPSNPFHLALNARRRFPLLDLLGGVTDSFDLGESRLSVAGWLVCRENAAALADTPAAHLPNAAVSSLDMSDIITQTRHATDRGLGQMIFSFEALAAGAQILTRLSVKRFTPAVTRGALLSAVHTYLANHPSVGGNEARGFGCLRADILSVWDEADRLEAEYEAYLDANQEELRAALIDGTLGTGVKILS